MKKITSMMLIVAFVVSLLAACTVVRYDTKIEYVEQDGKLIIVKSCGSGICCRKAGCCCCGTGI